MTLIKLMGTSSLSVVQYVKHISTNIPLHYFTKGGSGAEPPKNFWGVNNPPLIKEIFLGEGGGLLNDPVYRICKGRFLDLFDPPP